MHTKPSAEVDGSAPRHRGQTDGIEFGICTRSRGINVTDHPGINRAEKSFIVITDRNCHGSGL
jgi:hypothetical protein